MTFRLSQWQLTVVTFLTTLGVTPFTFDSAVLEHLHRNAWLALLPSLGFGLLGTVVALRLLARFPGQSIVDYAPRALGPWAGRLYLALLGILLLGGAPMNLHVLTRIVAFTELPNTPTFATAGAMVAVLAYSCYFGPEVFSRVAEVLAALIALGLAVIFIAPLATVVPARLLPVGGFAWQQFLTPSVSYAWGAVRGFLCLLTLGGMVNKVQGMPSRAILAVLVAWLLLEMSLLLPVAVLGSGLAQEVHYPFIAVTGTISLRWLPFQRLTTVTILMWQCVMYVVLAFYLWSGAYLLTSACGSTRWRFWLMPAAVLTTYLAGMRPPAHLLQTLAEGWNYGVIIIGIGASAALLVAARARPAVGQGSA